ncbi:hypothetical protein AAHA92_05359 [Salvia divinorum]|uniref:Uncharacterized protein n=1 Tax=Salvia divinorum TaxID=28513 RepID=A0ABD1I679_SALDI
MGAAAFSGSVILLVCILLCGVLLRSGSGDFYRDAEITWGATSSSRETPLGPSLLSSCSLKEQDTMKSTSNFSEIHPVSHTPSTPTSTPTAKGTRNISSALVQPDFVFPHLFYRLESPTHHIYGGQHSDQSFQQSRSHRDSFP